MRKGEGGKSYPKDARKRRNTAPTVGAGVNTAFIEHLNATFHQLDNAHPVRQTLCRTAKTHLTMGYLTTLKCGDTEVSN